MVIAIPKVSTCAMSAELALFDRDPSAYETKTAAKVAPRADVVTIEAGRVGRFLEFLRRDERTERYRRNVQHSQRLGVRSMPGETYDLCLFRRSFGRG